jgi:hypothetical protein
MAGANQENKMARGEWFLVWTPGDFIGCGYTLDSDWAPEGALIYSCMGQPDWWPEEVGGTGVKYAQLSAVLPDTADESALIKALEVLK